MGKDIVLKVTDFAVSSVKDDKLKLIRGNVKCFGQEAFAGPEFYRPATDVFKLDEKILMEKISNNERPEFKVPCYEEFKKIVYLCWSHKPKDSPTFSQLGRLLQGVYSKVTKGLIESEY